MGKCLNLVGIIKSAINNGVENERKELQRQLDTEHSVLLTNLTQFRIESHNEREQIKWDTKTFSIVEATASVVASVVFAVIMIAVRRFCNKRRPSEIEVLEKPICERLEQPRTPDEHRRNYRWEYTASTKLSQFENSNILKIALN